MSHNTEADGYIDLTGAENGQRLAEHQEFLTKLGVPQSAALDVDHIGINATNSAAFDALVERYRVPGRDVGIYDRGDRRIAVIERGPGLYRVELFEPRANITPEPGFVHYAFIWPDWQAHESELQQNAEIRRTGNLNGNAIVFLAVPDGTEAEIVTRPIQF